MRYSTDWEDYELIDCSDGYKLERWTNEILVRPDPQVIWKSKKENKYWFQPDATYLRSRTGATVACLKEGASVVHVDASRGMVQWAKENAAASQVSNAQVRWIVDDCIKFVQREIRRGNKYDIIILDPPSYGRGPKGEIWHLEDSIYDFVKLVEQVLSDAPLMVMLNSYTTGLSASVMKYILDDIITNKRGGRVEADEIGVPVSSNARVLPC